MTRNKNPQSALDIVLEEIKQKMTITGLQRGYKQQVLIQSFPHVSGKEKWVKDLIFDDNTTLIFAQLGRQRLMKNFIDTIIVQQTYILRHLNTPQLFTILSDTMKKHEQRLTIEEFRTWWGCWEIPCRTVKCW